MGRRNIKEEMDEWSGHFESENKDANYVLRFFLFIGIIVPGLGLLLAAFIIVMGGAA